jgi:hypothetical protein
VNPLRIARQRTERNHGRFVSSCVVVVVVLTIGAGVVVVVTSEVVVRLYGVEPQPDNTAIPASNAAPVIRRIRDAVTIMV